jgi:hypothetical protein
VACIQKLQLPAILQNGLQIRQIAERHRQKAQIAATFQLDGFP